jgi:hypothetical protein
MWPQFAILMLFMFLWAGFAGIHRRGRLRAWRTWTKGKGLIGTGKGAISYQFPAEPDGLKVSLQLKHGSDGDRTCLTVSMSSDDDAPAPGGVVAAIDPSVSIHPRLLSARRGLECGDAAFNKALVVRGDEVLCAALFDHATRLTLQRCLARHDFVVESGKVSCMTRGILTESEVKSVADTLLEVARQLRISAASIPARLLDVRLCSCTRRPGNCEIDKFAIAPCSTQELPAKCCGGILEGADDGGALKRIGRVSVDRLELLPVRHLRMSAKKRDSVIPHRRIVSSLSQGASCSFSQRG